MRARRSRRSRRPRFRMGIRPRWWLFGFAVGFVVALGAMLFLPQDTSLPTVGELRDQLTSMTVDPCETVFCAMQQLDEIGQRIEEIERERTRIGMMLLVGELSISESTRKDDRLVEELTRLERQKADLEALLDSGALRMN